MIEIRIVYDKELPKSKVEWQSQQSNQQNPVMLTIRDSAVIGYSDYGYKFRLENFDGTVKRWLE